MATRMHDEEVDVDADLVKDLLLHQLPDLAYRTLFPVEPWGTDHAIWRLGDDLVVRLPRIQWAAGQADLEATWLPLLAEHVPVAVPQVVAVGEPALGYPYRWSVQRWLPGEGADLTRLNSPEQFALDLANVVKGLHATPTKGAPPPRNRARPLDAYDDAARAAIGGAAHLINADAAITIWEDALAAEPYEGPLVWVHGDLEGNCLQQHGLLRGIVDWGSACTGDPAVDVQVVWSSLFTDNSRRVFLDALEVDDATLRRSRGAAIHQACSALPYYLHTHPAIVERSRHKLEAIGVRTTSPP